MIHWQHHTFQVACVDAGIEPASLAFALDTEGNVAQIRMQAISPTADLIYDYHDLLVEPQAAKYRCTSASRGHLRVCRTCRRGDCRHARLPN